MARLLHCLLVGVVAAWLAPQPAEAQGASDAHSRLAQPGDQTTAEMLDRLFGQLHQAGDEKAAKTVEQAIWNLWARSGSPTVDALLGQAEKAMAASQHGVAISILDTAIDLRPEFPEAWNRRATAYYLDRQFERSLADIARVLELEPRHFGALSGLGVIRREQGDLRGALSAFRRALAIHPFQSAARRAVKELELQVEQDI